MLASAKTIGTLGRGRPLFGEPDRIGEIRKLPSYMLSTLELGIRTLEYSENRFCLVTGKYNFGR